MNERQRAQEMWIAYARLLAVIFAATQVFIVSFDDPGRNLNSGVAITAILAVGAVAFLFLTRRSLSSRNRTLLGLVALVFDTAIIYAYVFTHAFSPGTQASRLLVLAVIEAAVRYGVAGGVWLTVANIPLLCLVEYTRPGAVNGFEIRNVTLTLGIQLITGLVVGGLTRQLHGESSRAEARAAEAEQLRDEIGRHADRLEVANRCARALASSLDMKESFQTFARELKTSFQYDRVALILADRGQATVVADDGVGADDGHHALVAAAPRQRARGSRPHRPDGRPRRPEGRVALRGGGASGGDRHALARDRPLGGRGQAARRTVGLPARARTRSPETTSTC